MKDDNSDKLSVAGMPQRQDSISPSFVIETSFGKSLEDAALETQIEPATSIGDEALPAATDPKPTSKPPVICPRATMELSHAHELLASLRYNFSAEAEEMKKSLHLASDFIESPLDAVEEESQNAIPQILEESKHLFPDDGSCDQEFEREKSAVEPVIISLRSHNPERLSQLMELYSSDEPRKPFFVREDSDDLSFDQLNQHLSGESDKKDHEELPPELPLDLASTVEEPNHLESMAHSSFWERCLRLEEAENWSALNDIASQEQGAHASEVKYWWMVSQFRVGSLSPSLLTAPLQELLKTLLEERKEKLTPFDSEEASNSLIKLSREILSGAILSKQSSLQVYDLLSLLREFTRGETSFRKEETALAEQIEEKEAFKRTEFENQLLVELKEVTKEKKRKKKRESLENPSLENLEFSTPKGVSLDHNAGGQSFNFSALPGTFPLRRLSSVGAFAVLLLGALFLWKGFFSGADNEIDLAFKTLLPLESPKLQPPTQSQLEPRMFKGMLLDAGGGTVVGFNRQVSSTTTKAAPVLSLPRGVVDTSGPIEPRDLLVDRDTPKVEERNVIAKDYVKGLAADMIGGRSREPLSEAPSPKLFTVIADTNILSEPSFEAQILERIKRGAKVRVVRQIGDWLLLRSQDGKPGYILRQDAIEAGLSRS